MADLEYHISQLKTNSKASTIARAVKHENKLRFHTEVNLDAKNTTVAVNDFLSWVSEQLPKDKYLAFVNMFSHPVKTVQLVSKIYRQLEKVFDSKNAVENYRFIDQTLELDWNTYKKQILNQPQVWMETGWEKLQTKINSILVVDLPENQDGNLPEPYFYWLDIDKVFNYGFDGSKIIFLHIKTADDKLIVLDDEYYRVVDFKNESIGAVLLETEHNLGYCPATFFWTDYLSSVEKDIKKNPISALLSDLNWLLFYKISKMLLDMSGSYPIYWGYEVSCDFEDTQNGDYCDGGFIRGEKGLYKLDAQNGVVKCPVCSSKRMSGPGTFVEVPVPSQDNGNVDLSEPVGKLSVDHESLKYTSDEVQRLENSIENSATGAASNVANKQALNEDQIWSSYVERTNVLTGIKTNFEKAIQFVNDTICKLRYSNAYLGSYINMGTEFYIKDIKDLYTYYKLAKTSGASETELDKIADEIQKTKYRNDPDTLQRLQILNNLEPYRHLSREELFTLRKENALDENLFQVKINFAEYIAKFERENMDVVGFGSNNSFDKKIRTIAKTLKSYADRRKNTGGSD